MNCSYQYSLEKGSKKHLCPGCGKKRLVKYVDSDTGLYLPKQYGRCDRESKCGYELNPYKNGYLRKNNDGSAWQSCLRRQYVKPEGTEQADPVFIPTEVFKASRSGYEKNTFVQNLLSKIDYPFQVRDVENVTALYHLGTVQVGNRAGAAIFPFIDRNGNVRAMQAKEFDETNHTISTDWLHSIIGRECARKSLSRPDWLTAYNENEIKVSCLFGEHLLTKFPNNPVALVEAPKTAIYGALHFGFPDQPQDLLWLAVYNLGSLNLTKCRVLEGREVLLFPDLSKDGSAHRSWSEKAMEIQSKLPGTLIKVSDLLERLAPIEDREQGKDLGDYLIKLDWRLLRGEDYFLEFRPEGRSSVSLAGVKSEKSEASKPLISFPIEEVPEITAQQVYRTGTATAIHDRNSCISALETYFANVAIPSRPLKLDQCTTIIDVSKFVDSHLAMLRGKNRSGTFLPYLRRLKNLKQILNNDKCIYNEYERNKET